jgi:type IV pilus assembly protein PilQ
VSSDEVVSFKSDVPLGEAITSLNELWKKLAKKVVVDRSGLSSSEQVIGINIQAMYWKDAFESLLRQNGVWYSEYQDYIDVAPLSQLNQPAQQTQTVTTPTTPVKQDTDVNRPETMLTAQQPTIQQSPVMKVDSAEIYAKMREVSISSVFFVVDRTALAQSGISFSLFRGRGLNLGIEFTGSEKIATPIFNMGVNPTDPRLAVDVNMALAMFESEQLGEVIARPRITVRSGSSTRFQSGQDFSIKTRDFSGNLIDQFYNTGTILTVAPTYYTHDGVDFISLSYNIERSSATPGEVTTLVDIVKASGVINLLDGEETYVGGLYQTQELTVREGVPLLKDLPWWFLGLRYLFGFDSKSVIKKELIVLMKAELVPVVKDRVTDAKGQSPMQDIRREMREDEQRRTGKKN